MPEVERSAVARRRAALISLVVLPAILLPALLRERHQLGALVRENAAMLGRLTLVAAGICAAAAIIAGVVTWRRESRRGETIER